VQVGQKRPRGPDAAGGHPHRGLHRFDHNVEVNRRQAVSAGSLVGGQAGSDQKPACGFLGCAAARQSATGIVSPVPAAIDRQGHRRRRSGLGGFEARV